MIRKYLLVVIILFVGFSGFTQAEVEVNEVKINDLKDELRQLDALLSKHKEQEAKKEAATVPSWAIVGVILLSLSATIMAGQSAMYVTAGFGGLMTVLGLAVGYLHSKQRPS